MSEFIFFLLGGGLFSAFFIIRQHRPRGAEPSVEDQREYQQLWSEAVNLLAFNGQISEAQLEAIRPKQRQISAALPPSDNNLPQGEGFSSDRRKIEIARAKAGLPPADNLRGMFSADVRQVHEARITYGTAT